MKLLTVLAFGIVLTISSCAMVQQARNESSLELYQASKSSIPSLDPKFTRLYIYRPQAFVGIVGSPIIIINGIWMGNRSNPYINNKLVPGAVFIVDIPNGNNSVWWYQNKESSDMALNLSSQDKRVWYLKWRLKPTHGYLEIVEAPKGEQEIESLLYSGYIKLE